MPMIHYLFVVGYKDMTQIYAVSSDSCWRINDQKCKNDVERKEKEKEKDKKSLSLEGRRL